MVAAFDQTRARRLAPNTARNDPVLQLTPLRGNNNLEHIPRPNGRSKTSKSTATHQWLDSTIFPFASELRRLHCAKSTTRSHQCSYVFAHFRTSWTQRLVYTFAYMRTSTDFPLNFVDVSNKQLCEHLHDQMWSRATAFKKFLIRTSSRIHSKRQFLVWRWMYMVGSGSIYSSQCYSATQSIRNMVQYVLVMIGFVNFYASQIRSSVL